MLHSGERQRGGNNPIDWAYFLGQVAKEPLELTSWATPPAAPVPGFGESGMATMIWLVSQNENVTSITVPSNKIYNNAGNLLDPDYGYNPAWGAALDELVFPESFGYSQNGPWENLDDATKGALLGALAQAWLTQSRTWTPAQWAAVKNDDGTALGGTTQCNAADPISTDAGSRMLAAMFILTNQSQAVLGFSNAAGDVPVATTNALANWAATIWPACNWSQFLR